MIDQLTKRIEALEEFVFPNGSKLARQLEHPDDNPFATLSYHNKFTNHHRFTDKEGNLFIPPTEVGEVREYIDNLTGQEYSVGIVEVEDEEDYPEPKTEPVARVHGLKKK